MGRFRNAACAKRPHAGVALMRMRLLKYLFALTLASLTTAAIANDAPANHEHARGGNAQQAFGVPGDKRDVRRTIQVRMVDEMRFIPDRIDVQQGETIRLVLTNNGKLVHELVLGSRKDLEEHATQMRSGKDAMQHDEPYIAHVPPGQVGEIVWKFNRAGRFDFACLVPGHFEAGMMGTVNVTR